MEAQQTFLHTAEPATQADIQAFEAEHGTRLPDDYKAHLLAYNGGYPKRRTFFKDDHDFTLNQFFSIGTGRTTLHGARRRTYGELHNDLVFFADETGGDLFCLSVGPEDYGSVYYVAHESYKPPKRKDMSLPRQYGKGVYFLAPSFTAFLQGLSAAEAV